MTLVAKERNIEIDTLRGLACFLLVAYHVIGIPGGGIKVADSSVLRVLADSFVYVRMPLFTFLSGYVYALKPVKFGGYENFVIGKLRRLGVPMLFVGVPFAFAQAMSPDANTQITILDALLSPILPINHFWYLPSLFLIFIAILFLEKFQWLSSPVIFIKIMCVAILLFLMPTIYPDFLSINGALYLMPFFLLGVAAYRFFPQIEAWPRFILIISMFGSILISILMAMNYFDISAFRRGLLPLFLATSCCLGLYALKFRSEFLVNIGSYSYTIFLFHSFFAVASRIVLNRLEIQSEWLLFWNGLVFGIVGPIVLHKIFIKNRFSKFLFLGMRLNKKLEQKKQLSS